LFALHGNTPAQLLEAKHSLRFADFAVGPGVLTTRLLRSFAMPADRLRHIPNGVDPSRAKRRPREPGRPLRIGYVGRLTNGDKRVRDLIPVVKGLVDAGISIEVCVAGDGPEREFLENELRPYSVRFLGAVDHDRLYSDVYPELDVLLLFSDSEAFGIVLLEALANKVVPVTSEFPGCALEGIVQSGVNGLMFPVADVGAAIECVARLNSDESLLSRLSDAGPVHVDAQFSWSRCVDQWEQVLQSVMDAPARDVPTRPEVVAADSGRLDRMRLAPGAVDALRRLRRSLFGPSDAWAASEEWPWVARSSDLDGLLEMERLRSTMSKRLDYSGDVPMVPPCRKG
jgi:glycosyltransferase involved in cell wall biosynthesis